MARMAFQWKPALPVLWTEGLWVALVGGLLVWEETGTVAPDLRPLPVALAGTAVTFAGVILSYLANRELITGGTGWPALLAEAGAVATERPNRDRGPRAPATPRLPRRLVTTGLYGRLRNPQALGMLLTFTGTAVIVDSKAIWLLPLIAAAYLLIVVLPVERRRLEELFGEEYEAYRTAVPALLPSASDG